MKNKYFVSGDFAVIEITNALTFKKFYTIIDREDLEKVKQNAYRVNLTMNETTYAVYTCQTTRTSKRLHRLIMNTPKGLVVDHINHNGLDNRKENLRNCTLAENNQNKRKYKDPKNINKEALEIRNRLIKNMKGA
jgi:HNH endonuclease